MCKYTCMNKMIYDIKKKLDGVHMQGLNVPTR